MWLLRTLVTLLLVASVRAAEGNECVDLDSRCEDLASIGECVHNARKMKRLCPYSCEVCGGDNEEEEEEEGYDDDEEEEDDNDSDDDDESLEDEDDEMNDFLIDIEGYEEEEEGQNLPEAVFWSSGADLGKAQRILHEDATRPEDLTWVIAKARNYMKQVVPYKFGPVMSKLCRNRHRDCAYWAWKGECHTNAEYMKTICAPMCQSCHYLTRKGRCAMEPGQTNTWGAGDLNRLFEKLTSEPFLSTHNVQVHSSPAKDGPWVISMDNIVTEDQANHFIELGHEVGFTQSAEVAETAEVVEGRTSINAWCTGKCAEDPLVRQVSERLSELTSIPIKNLESIQLLKHEAGQTSSTYHDFIDDHVSTKAGPRILTVFIYLNDVEEGGGTRFEELDVTVLPKRGRVVIWPNVLDNNPNQQDWRTRHNALPVENGVKYGANAWFHLRDFQTPYNDGCMD